MAVTRKTTATTKTATTNSNGWNNIHGRMNIYMTVFDKGTKNEHLSFSLCVGQKNESGEYINAYIPVFFKSGLKLCFDDGVNVLDVKNAFFTNRVNKNGEIKLILMITEATVINE